MTNESTRSAPGERAHLLVLYNVGEGEDVFVVFVVRRGFAAISKVPPVMPAEAKSKGEIGRASCRERVCAYV